MVLLNLQNVSLRWKIFNGLSLTSNAGKAQHTKAPNKERQCSRQRRRSEIASSGNLEIRHALYYVVCACHRPRKCNVIAQAQGAEVSDRICDRPFRVHITIALVRIGLIKYEDEVVPPITLSDVDQIAQPGPAGNNMRYR